MIKLRQKGITLHFYITSRLIHRMSPLMHKMSPSKSLVQSDAYRTHQPLCLSYFPPHCSWLPKLLTGDVPPGSTTAVPECANIWQWAGIVLLPVIDSQLVPLPEEQIWLKFEACLYFVAGLSCCGLHCILRLQL